MKKKLEIFLKGIVRGEKLMSDRENMKNVLGPIFHDEDEDEVG